MFKKNHQIEYRNSKFMYPFAEGEIISLEKVNNPIIASLILGNGFAIEPAQDEIRSPVDGTVKDISSGGRAITVITEDGLIVVIHMGTRLGIKEKPESVELKINEGDKLETGQTICTIDLEQAKNQGRDTTISLIVSNFDIIKDFNVYYGITNDVKVPVVSYDL